MMTKSLRNVSLEVRNLTYYDGLNDVDNFFDVFEHEVPEHHCFQAIDFALHAMPARWWGTHKDSFDGWWDYRRVMRLVWAP